MGKVIPSPQWKDTGASKEVVDGEPALVTRLEVDNTSTYIDKDGSGNMTFTDAVSGTITLAQLFSAAAIGGLIVVASSGGNYTTIQAALTANPTANLVFLVYPGTYTNDTINFTANGQTVIGLGERAQTQVTNTAQICNFGAYTDCRLANIKLTGTYTSAIDLASGTGTCNFEWVDFVVNASGTIAGSPTALNSTGTVRLRHCTIDYNNTATSGGQWKRAINLNTGAVVKADSVIFDLDCSGTSTASLAIYGEGSGITEVFYCEADIDDANATYALFLGVVGGSGTSQLSHNDIRCNATAGTGIGLYLDASADTDLIFRSTHNHIRSLGGTAAYSFMTANDARVYLTSQFDDIIAADGLSKGAASTVVYTASFDNGDLNLTGDIAVAGTVDGIDVAAHDVAATGVHGVGASTIASAGDITTHGAVTTSIHNFDASGNAPPQAHGSDHTDGTDDVADMVGDSGAGGTHGLVPAPGTGDAAAGKYLKADGVWTTPAGGGDVTGPASSTDNEIARQHSTTGKVLQTYTSNPPTISDTGDVNIDGDLDVENIVVSGNVDGVDVSAHVTDTSTHGASDIADVSDIAVDANLSVAAQAAIAASHAQDTDTDLGALSTKDPPIDADKVVYRDSTDSDSLVTSTWTQVKAFLKTYFDTVYNKYVHPNHSGEVTSVADGATTIANSVVTYAKMQNVSATDKVLGRETAGAGAVEEIACTAAGRALLDDADAAAQKTTLGLNNVENTAHSTDAHTMTLDGRDVSADGTKLDTIATNADVTGDNAPQAHKASHENTGADEISVAALSGLLADDQHVLDSEVLAAVAADGYSKVIWKDTPAAAMTDSNRTTTLGYTDLDLTSDTSSDANFAILHVGIHLDSITGTAYGRLFLRKNGTNGERRYAVVRNEKGDIAGSWDYQVVILGLDTDEILEYSIVISGTIQIDTEIYVVGYIE